MLICWKQIKTVSVYQMLAIKTKNSQLSQSIVMKKILTEFSNYILLIAFVYYKQLKTALGHGM